MSAPVLHRHGWHDTRPPRRATLIGEAIRSWCQRNHVSQSKLAERLGVDHSYVSRIAAGQRIPSPDMVRKIADALDIPVEDMALLYFEIDPLRFRDAIVENERQRIKAALTPAWEGVA